MQKITSQLLHYYNFTWRAQRELSKASGILPHQRYVSVVHAVHMVKLGCQIPPNFVAVCLEHIVHAWTVHEQKPKWGLRGAATLNELHSIAYSVPMANICLHKNIHLFLLDNLKV